MQSRLYGRTLTPFGRFAKLPPNKTQHKRALSAEEVGQLLNDFDGHGGNFQTIKAFQLMWLTLSARMNPSKQNGPSSTLRRRSGPFLHVG
jgi:hypothetical protein